MKRTIKTIMIGAVAMLFAATSCQKGETPAAQSDEAISVSIQGIMDEFASQDGPKATTEQVVRVMWASGDKVYAYDGNGYLGEIEVTTQGGDARYAYLNGSISGTESDNITLVYANGCTPVFNGGVLTFDISGQGAAQFPFVLYATLKNTDVKSGKFVPFHFATSVMKVNGTGVGTSGTITTATVNNVNTVCQITLGAKGAVSSVTGTTSGTITRSAGFSASADGRAVFTMAMAGTATGSGREVSIERGGKTYVADFTGTEIKTGASYNSVYAFTESN